MATKYQWTKEMTEWLAKRYNKTPEQVEALDGGELDKFLHDVTMDECRLGDTPEANIAADIVDIVCKL